MDEIRQLEEAIAALEAQRPVLGDAVVELALDSMLQKLAALKAGQGEAEHEAQQRKMVTVLFADLSGFTALAEQMDAEDITDLMNALWERLDRIITQRRGRIDKHIGDAIMAVWGAEAAQEDDAEQAIRAALDMQAELMRLNNNNEIPGLKALPDEQTIAMRIGINTGAALLGVVGTTGEITAIGDTVNTASRLQNAAPLNGIIISHDTFRHVRGLFRVRALEPLALKGKAEPVAVYLVEKARPHAFRLATRGFEDLDTRMIGRGEELEQLQADYMEGLNEQNPRMVTIIGEAGVGKSRLLYEFSSWLELQNHLTAAFKIRATQQTSSVPGLLIRQLLTTQLEIRESDPAEVIIARLAHGLEKTPGSEVPLNNRALILGTWAGFDLPDDNGFIGLIGARQLRDRGMIHLAELLSASAAEVPLALLLEDLQWADEQSLDAIEFIQRACAHVPLFTICVARPGFLERRPDWPALCSTMLELRPLNENESRTLIQEILQRARQIPEALCNLIIQRSEGNPFYIEELIKMLIEEGVIQIREQEWLIDSSRLETLPIPATLTGVLQARLDSLPASEKLALQRASILGRIFWDRAVAQLGKTEDRPEQDEAVQKPLNGLRNRRLIYRRDKPAFEGTNEFIFVHVLLRDVAYESVLKRERRHYHAEAARWLGQTARAAGRADEYAVLIAEHYEQAGEMLSAQEWYERAAGSASLRYANAEARRCLTHALALTPANDQHHSYDLRLAREKVLNLLGDRGAQLEDLNALEEIANALGDPRRQAEVALRRAHYAEITAKLAGALYPSDGVAEPSALHIETARRCDKILGTRYEAGLRSAVIRKAARMLENSRNPFGVYTFGPPENPNFLGTPSEAGGFHIGTNSHLLEAAGFVALACQMESRPEFLVFVYDQFNWVLGMNPYGISLMEGVGSVFLPSYHHRYTFAGVKRGAVPGGVVNGITWRAVRDDRPFLDISGRDIPAYESNEVWLPHNTAFLKALAHLKSASIRQSATEE